MEIQKLKDICLTEITDGTHQTPTYSEYGYIFLSSKNVTTQKIDWDNVMFIPEKLHEELYKRVAPQIDDILLAKNGTTGVAAIVDRDIVFDIYVSLALIRPNTEIVMPRYLLYAINNPVVKGYFDSSLKGIGVPNLHLKNIRETPIKIYDLETQKAIVEKLDKVCELISLRKQQLEKLDELVKTRFVEMFGDCKTNPKNWKTKALEKIANVGSSKRVFVEELQDSGIPFYRGTEIGALAEKKAVIPALFITEEHYKQVCETTGKPQKGDLLMPSICPDGRIWIVDTDEPFYFKDGRVLWVHLTSANYNSVFLLYTLKDRIMTDYASIASGTTFAELKIFALKKCKIFDVPLELQNQFANFVERVDQQKQTVQQSLEKLELMKKALMQEYFG